MQKRDFETINQKRFQDFEILPPSVFEVPFATPSIDVHILHMSNITGLTNSVAICICRSTQKRHKQ